MISKAYEQENMNQAKKVGVYMDFLESNPDLRFQKKNEYHRGPVILMSKNWIHTNEM